MSHWQRIERRFFRTVLGAHEVEYKEARGKRREIARCHACLERSCFLQIERPATLHMMCLISLQKWDRASFEFSNDLSNQISYFIGYLQIYRSFWIIFREILQYIVEINLKIHFFTAYYQKSNIISQNLL